MIKLYTVHGCEWCGKAKTWLQKNKISYQELNTTDVDQYRHELIFKTGQLAVPVFEVNNRTIVGFNEQLLKTTLKGF